MIRMLSRWRYPVGGRRDLRIDWLRGLAMTCVIVDHSQMSSLLRWFSYERFWVVTAAEVFVVLSGITLGMVYGHKLVRGGWAIVVSGLGRRALTLYVAFLAVTLSVLAISLAGLDVHPLTTWDYRSAAWFLDPRTMNAAAWRDIALMRYGPWVFEIVGLYVWLIVAAAPCLVALHFGGWRPLLAVSWGLYLLYRLSPHPLTNAEFESTFPLLAWQLLFVHGLAIGYHRERLSAFVTRCPTVVPIAVAGASLAFVGFALSNPSTSGPSWLHWNVVSPQLFTYLYSHYFTLTDLGIGRLLNLAVALPVGYALLTWCWTMARPLGIIFITLGQQSLAAFVLHVYGVLLIEHLPQADEFWANTLVQIVLIVSIAAVLYGAQHVPLRRRPMTAAAARPLAA
jgi:hypothetical protein